MSNPTTTNNNASELIDHPIPITASSADATGTLSPVSAIPSDPMMNSSSVDAPLVAQLREAPVDPRIVALRAMFPDYDDLVLQSVLDSVGGNQDRAIDTLLGMSDPNYKSETRPEEQHSLSQTELDEEFARRLMLDEQEQQQQAWAQEHAQRPQQLPPHPNQQQSPGAAAPTVGGDAMGEFQQQFSKIAESGKKTFGTIFSKVKAKIQEFDQPKPGQGSNGGTQPTWGASSGYDANQYQPAPQGGQPYPARRQTYPAPQSQQPAYYDPNRYTPPPQPNRSPSPPITLSPPPRTSAVQGYDVTPDPPSVDRLANNGTPPPVSGTSARTSSSPSRPQRAPIDGGKLGLLPKRPVSLLRTQDTTTTRGGSQSPHQIQRTSSEDDSDGLEYTESPFEERKK